jgi:hypothetical protein
LDAYKYVGGRNKGYETWLREQEATVLKEYQKQLDDRSAARPEKAARKKKGK